jgi:hypothetical protein
METEISRIVEVMKDALLHKLGDEVDLIFQYGSHLKGTAHKYSDIDISYAPVHESTRESITVMVGETMVDLYPMQWSHLERMAEFNDLSSMVLLESRIVYRRTPASAERFRALSARLLALLQPEAQPQMVRLAQEIFQNTGYAYYLLHQQAASGHWLGCVQQAQSILKTILHCLAVCNQACIDTRKMAQVMALPKLPVGFAETVERIAISLDPGELRAACDTLLHTTRDLLLAEQRQVLCQQASFPAVFNSGYPELQGDLQRVMLACERRDVLSLKTSLISLYLELSLGITRVLTGIEYSNFNALSEYEQDLVALGFPPLIPYLASGDFDQLHRQCVVFGEHLKRFLAERSVDLNAFDTLDELRTALAAR